MPAARLRLAPGQRHVHAADFEDGEALAHRLDLAEAREHRWQIGRRDAEDFQIEILGIEPEQQVAHEPAHDPGAAAGLRARRRNGARRLDNGERRRLRPCRRGETPSAL